MTENNRNAGIDLLKILSMFMVIILHVNLASGFLAVQDGFPCSYQVAWILEIISYCAVNCYALVSGYVGSQHGFKLKNIFNLWICVVFYSVIITIGYVIITEDFQINYLVKAIFPIIFDQYWFFTAYFCMFFFIPLMNLFIKMLSIYQKKVLCSLLIGIFSVLGIVSIRANPGGYTVIWMIILYLIGASLNSLNLFEDRKCIWGGICSVCNIDLVK